MQGGISEEHDRLAVLDRPGTDYRRRIADSDNLDAMGRKGMLIGASRAAERAVGHGIAAGQDRHGGADVLLDGEVDVAGKAGVD